VAGRVATETRQPAAPAGTSKSTLSFSFLGVPVAVRCSDPIFRRLFVACYGHPVGRPRRDSLHYAVTRAADGLSLVSPGKRRRRPRGPGDLLYLLDGDLSVQLQRRRPELYFLHSAVVARRGIAALLIGPSGIGKSTTTWALLHHGFEFKGDELAPVDLDQMRVRPFFRALCLKSPPPAPYRVPNGTPRTSRGWHIAAHRLPGGRDAKSLPVAAMFFLRRDGANGQPVVRRLSPAECVARLYASALNALAHREAGLAPAVRLARAVPGFEVDTASLTRAARAMTAVLRRGAAPGCAHA
jgi:hypothetical protein